MSLFTIVDVIKYYYYYYYLLLRLLLGSVMSLKDGLFICLRRF
jgi:hypothetical protein